VIELGEGTLVRMPEVFCELSFEYKHLVFQLWDEDRSKDLLETCHPKDWLVACHYREHCRV
jgi:hypothetical protein